MKKIVSVLLSLVIIIGAFAGVSITASAVNPVKTKDEAVAWLNNQDGATYNFGDFYDDYGNYWYGTQCVEFVRAYVNYLVNGDPWADAWGRPTGNGNSIWQNSLWSELGWIVYENTTDFLPQPGDIFSSGLPGTNVGHTGVVISSDLNTAWIADSNARTVSSYDGDPVWVHQISWKSADSNSGYGATHFIRPWKCTTHTWDNGTVTVEPTCKKDGEKTYKCTVCGETKTEKVAKGEKYHKYKVFATVKATLYSNGYLGKRCSICKKEAKSTIYRPKTLTLSKNAFVYDGEAKKPAVIVNDVKGNAIDSKYYTVAYKNNTNVGEATVSVKFSVRYSGLKSATFKIVPKGTSIISVKPFARGFTANWNKQATQTSGYQLKYSTSKDLKSNYKIVTVPGNGTLKKSVEGISSNKTYYVTVRTYKTVNKTKYYSVWSDTVSTKTLTDQVKNLKQTKVTKNSVGLSWDKVSGAKCYQLQLSSNNGKSWKILSSKLTNTSATTKNLKAGTRCSVRVRALVGSKKIKGAYSNTLKTQTLCIAPTVTLKAKAGAATASWKKVTGAKSYLIYKSANNKEWLKAGSTAKLSFTLSGLTGGKKIYVKVHAVNAYGKKGTASKVKNVTVKKVNYEAYLPYYADVINQYKILIDKGLNDENDYNDYLVQSDKKYYYVDSAWVLNQIYLDSNKKDNLYYSLYDLNQDGFPELFIFDTTANNDYIYGAFTYVNGSIKELYSAKGYGKSVNVFKNGTIVVRFVGGTPSTWNFYQYKSESKKSVLVERLLVDEIGGDEYYKGINNQTKISSDEAKSVIKKYTGQSSFNPTGIKFTRKSTITGISSSKLGEYNGIIRKYMEGKGAANPAYGYYDSAAYYYLTLKTPYKTKKALVVETTSGAYNQYSFVYIVNNNGKVVKLFEQSGDIRKYTSDKSKLLFYGYYGSGDGGYYILQYNSAKKTYTKTKSYYHEMDTRDSVSKEVNSLTKSYIANKSKYHIIY